MTRLRRAKLLDLAAASPLIAWYVFAIGGLVIQIAAVPRKLLAAEALAIAGQVATMIFLGLQITLFVIRHPPIRKSEGLLPRLFALVGANLAMAFLLLPRADPGPALLSLAYILVAMGTLASAWIAFRLGAGYGVLPHARKLVTTGPYRRIRHPLYLAEQVATLGILIQYRQPWAAILGIAVFAAQIPRMHYEERVMTEAFPEYRIYAARTFRLIPGVY
jgi:protein-S-isoprenylcysteine O-methyltransferase Ste14